MPEELKEPVTNATEDQSNPSSKSSLSDLTSLLMQEKEKNNQLESRLSETESSLKTITEHILNHKVESNPQPELREVKDILEDLDQNKLNNTLPNVQVIADLIDLDTHVRTASNEENSIFYGSNPDTDSIRLGDKTREYFVKKLEESKGDEARFNALCESEPFNK